MQSEHLVNWAMNYNYNNTNRHLSYNTTDFTIVDKKKCG